MESVKNISRGNKDKTESPGLDFFVLQAFPEWVMGPEDYSYYSIFDSRESCRSKFGKCHHTGRGSAGKPRECSSLHSRGARTVRVQ